MTLYKHVLCQLRSAQQHTINTKSVKVCKGCKKTSHQCRFYFVMWLKCCQCFSMLVSYKVRKSREITVMLTNAFIYYFDYYSIMYVITEF